MTTITTSTTAPHSGWYPVLIDEDTREITTIKTWFATSGEARAFADEIKDIHEQCKNSPPPPLQFIERRRKEPIRTQI